MKQKHVEDLLIESLVVFALIGAGPSPGAWPKDRISCWLSNQVSSSGGTETVAIDFECEN